MFYCLHKPVHAITGSHNHECFMCCLLGHPFCPNTKATPKVQGIRVFHANANPGSSFLNPYQHQHTHTPAIRITRKRKQKKRKGMQDRRLRCTAGKKIGCSSPLMTLGTLRDASRSLLPGKGLASFLALCDESKESALATQRVEMQYRMLTSALLHWKDSRLISTD